LARLSVGERDARLLILRDQLFGPELACVTACPRCADRLELTFRVTDVLIPTAVEPPPLTLTLPGYELTFRLPDSTDLDALWVARESTGSADVTGSTDVAAVLLHRCIVDARREGVPCSPSQLPERVVHAIARRMAEADPQAEVELTASCLACDHSWLAPFDIAAFLWQEVDAWARRLLDDIHRLARAYGWREADVLALGPRRRQFYLDRAGG
jgi:hypothetical protein